MFIFDYDNIELKESEMYMYTFNHNELRDILNDFDNRGFKRNSIAKKAGIEPATLLKLEKGLIKNPGINTLFSLADELGIEPGKLVIYEK